MCQFSLAALWMEEVFDDPPSLLSIVDENIQDGLLRLISSLDVLVS